MVGSEDFEIRVYQNEEILSEVTEVDRVLHLCPIHDSLYGYGARREAFPRVCTTPFVAIVHTVHHDVTLGTARG